METNVWWHSKQIWTAVIAAVAMTVQEKYGYIVSPEFQVQILAGIMVLLRIITKEPVTWKNQPEDIEGK